VAAGGFDWESSMRGEALCGILVECWTLGNGLDPAAGTVLFSGEGPAPGIRYKRYHFQLFSAGWQQPPQVGRNRAAGISVIKGNLLQTKPSCNLASQSYRHKPECQAKEAWIEEEASEK
jgi:hypothetical protein